MAIRDTIRDNGGYVKQATARLWAYFGPTNREKINNKW
jgi:hypothetical protein